MRTWMVETPTVLSGCWTFSGLAAWAYHVGQFRQSIAAILPAAALMMLVVYVAAEFVYGLWSWRSVDAAAKTL